MEKCGNKLGCSNYAYPLLVTKILPPGVTGIILAAIMSALMSTLTSILNSKCMGLPKCCTNMSNAIGLHVPSDLIKVLKPLSDRN